MNALSSGPSGDFLPSVRLYRGPGRSRDHVVVCFRASLVSVHVETGGTQLKSRSQNVIVVWAGITADRVWWPSIKYTVDFGSKALSGARRYAEPTALSSWFETRSDCDTFIFTKLMFDLMLLPASVLTPFSVME